jgi:hypothetical protein
VAERESEGAVVAPEGRDNTTRLERRALLHRCRCCREGIGECPVRARSTAKADGLDASRALQRVLYRSAKQDPNRRFHALYDKVARGDILRRHPLVGLGRRACQPRGAGQ